MIIKDVLCRILLMSGFPVYSAMEGSKPELYEEPIVAKIRHIGLPTRGKYTVREEVQKAPTYDHPCKLQQTAVKISFPEEMRSEIFVNLLGYKEPNLLFLPRCKGRCSDPTSPHQCRATKVKDKKVKERSLQLLCSVHCDTKIDPYSRWLRENSDRPKAD